jgi:hypothetical protein
VTCARSSTTLSNQLVAKGPDDGAHPVLFALAFDGRCVKATLCTSGLALTLPVQTLSAENLGSARSVCVRQGSHRHGWRCYIKQAYAGRYRQLPDRSVNT